MQAHEEGQLMRVSAIINGKPRVFHVEPRMHLADALREVVGLTGTKVGCEQGVCGSCTILIDGAPMRSCLTLAVQAEGCSIETVESHSQGEKLNTLQDSFRRHHALQCGFCTAGMLATARSILAENPAPSRDEVREVMSGNLCRCTGYENVIDAITDPAVVEAARRGEV
ncbi:(2Fe-2S)-binding protein [Pseudomonas sp. 5Ae-yellow]|uniref:(2Fe-2S)-binding protein n=1 Tax=Pseudomonas sp. 5Ae-yellow TaxID=2759848 RepID=UPI0015F66351|nr:(2Fe-2S)-binding protein [Pseudomonas sp. 5Ae-yellow]MBA6420987.1 (2Fe-2S)-binding protein [Pseudomonas sp. 5Ae-yellow]